MPWIGDVASGQQIISAWGNNIRDHTVQVFVNKAEMTSQAVPKEGMIAHCSDTHITYIRVAGSWWVLAMPWRNFTARVWMSVQNSSFAEVSVLSGNGMWQQSMGRAHCLGSYQFSTGGFTSLNTWTLINTPVQMVTTVQAGDVKLYPYAIGTNAGGWSTWYDNNAAPGSRVIINNNPGGANANINVPGGNNNVQVELNMMFQCAADVDTP